METTVGRDEYYDEEYYYEEDYNNNNDYKNHRDGGEYQLCAACGLESEFVDLGTMVQCNYCDQVVYCSKECMEWHWENQHKRECSSTTSAMMNQLAAPLPHHPSSSKSCGSSTSYSSSGSNDINNNIADGKQEATTTTRTIAIIKQGDQSESTSNHDFQLDPNSPAARLQQIYSQDNGFINSEFEAYAQDYYAKKQIERQIEEHEMRRKKRWYMNCKGKLTPLLCVGVLVQVVTIFALALVYHSLEEKQQGEDIDIVHHNTTLEDDDIPDAANIWPVTTPSTPSIAIPPPPADLLHYCNPSAILTPEGRQSCSEICFPAQCCYMSESNPNHCWRDNLKECHEYRKACSVLSPLKEYNKTSTTTHNHHEYPPSEQHPPDPNNNDAAAAATASSPSSSSTTLSYYKTTVYPNAVVLFDKPEMLPPAPPTLLKSCQAGFLFDDPWSNNNNNVKPLSTVTSTLTCHEVCYRASCCWDDRLTNPGDRCWTHPNCKAYSAACSFLLSDHHHIGQQEHHIPHNNDNDNNDNNDNNNAGAAAPLVAAQEVCNPDQIHSSLDSLLQCQQSCMESECCWNSVFSKKCNDQQSQCNNQEVVEACGVLDGSIGSSSTSSSTLSPTTTATPASSSSSSSTAAAGLDDLTHPNTTVDLYSYETIQDACWNHDNSVPTHGHKSLCEQVCQAGSCCWKQQQEESSSSSSSSSSCPDYLPDDFCSKYEPCLVIELTGDHLQTQIEEACADKADLSTCVELCGEGTCCFTNDPWKTCAISQPDTVCSNYAACEILYSKNKNNQGDDNDNEDGGRRRRRQLLRQHQP